MQGYLFSVTSQDFTTYYLIDPYQDNTHNLTKVLTQTEMEDWMEKASGKRNINLLDCTPAISKSDAMGVVNKYIEESPYKSYPGVKDIEFQFLIQGINDKKSCVYSFIGKTEDKSYSFCKFYVNADGKLSDKNIVRSGGCSPAIIRFITKFEAIEVMKDYLKNSNISGELLTDPPFITYSYPCGDLYKNTK